MTYEELVEKVRELPIEQRKALINDIVDSLTTSQAVAEDILSNILELRGAAAHLRDQDAQEYVNQLRSEWDHRP